MVTIVKNLILLVVLHSIIWIAPQKLSAQVSVNFQVFYDDLSPYGEWVDNPDYGYVWVPDVAPGFTPYGTNGYWVFTDAGWTWVSNYAWGWAPFHYGRWYYDPVYGPVWVPGDEWGPGWVTWRRSEGYYGWAPIEPGISISVAYSSGYQVPNDRWRFVRDRDFGRTNINNYYVKPSGNTTIINNSVIINNVHIDNRSKNSYNAGPARNEVQTRSGRRIAPVVLKEGTRPGQNMRNGQLQIYRPQVQRNNGAGERPTPSRVVSFKDVKPAAERKAGTQRPRNNQPTREQSSDQPPRNQPTQQPPRNQPPTQPTQQPPRNQPTNQPTQQPPRNQPTQQPSQQSPRNQPTRPTHQPPRNQPTQQPPRNQPPTQPTQQPPRNQPTNQPTQQTPRNQPTRQSPRNQPAKQPRRNQPTKQPSRKQSTKPGNPNALLAQTGMSHYNSRAFKVRS
jgi:hypothetical protein